MIAATPGRRRRQLAWRSLAAFLLCALTVFVGPPAPSHATEPAGVEVELVGASASGGARTDVVTVSGTVINTGSQSLHGVRAQLWRSAAVLRSREALDEATTSGSVPLGRAVTATTALADLGAAPLSPGERREFTVRATLAELGLATTDATYWVGANVLTQATPEAVAHITAARTLVTLPGTAPAAVTGLVELSAQPRQVKPNLFTDEGLAAELAGPLRVLLDAAARPGASRVVDPALVAEVTDMADGYRVVDGDGSQPGAGREVARAWLDDLQALPAASGYRSLFARPELTAALRLGGEPLVERLLAASAEPAPDLPPLITLDEVDTETLTALERLGAPVLALRTGLPHLYVRVGGTPLVGAVVPSRVLAGRALADTPLNRSAVLEAYARAGAAQVRLLRSVADVEADRAASPAWVTPRPLAAVLADDPAVWTRTLTAAQADGVLGAGAPQALAALGDALGSYAAAAPASGVGGLIDAQVARAASQAWTGDADGRSAWLATVDARAGASAIAGGITLSALPRFTMSSAANEFPVTVTNTLPDDVVLRVVATMDSPQRIRLEPSAEVTVRAGQSAGVLLRAVATGNGVATAQVHAIAQDARRLTPDVAVAVEATNLGTVGWVIVLVSGAVLVVSTALRIRRVRARNRGGGHAR